MHKDSRWGETGKGLNKDIGRRGMDRGVERRGSAAVGQEEDRRAEGKNDLCVGVLCPCHTPPLSSTVINTIVFFHRPCAKFTTHTPRYSRTCCKNMCSEI